MSVLKYYELGYPSVTLNYNMYKAKVAWFSLWLTTALQGGLKID